MPSERFTDLRPLPGGSTRATLDGRREVVLKHLEPECFLDGRPHPDVVERLARFQQMLSPHLVPLLGVWANEDELLLAWAFDPADTLDVVATADRAAAMTATRAAVAALHDAGLVHGNVHERNVVYDGRVARLMHAAGLLHDDPAIDLAALREIGERWGVRPERTPVAASTGGRGRLLAAAVALALLAIIGGWWLARELA